MSQTFCGCQQLVNLDLPKFDTSSLKYMSNMFQNCSVLRYLDLSSFVGSSVISVQYAFSGCTMLTSLDLSNFKASSATNMEYMFSECQSLKSLNLSSFVTSKCTTMKYMFYNCKQLEILDISNFDTSKVSNMDYMFHNCENLISLDLSNFNISSIRTIKNMLSNCRTLMYLNLKLKSFATTNSISTDDFMSNISNDLKICIDSSVSNVFSINGIPSSCDDICFQKNIKIIREQRQCIASCKEDDHYKYELMNKCFLSCPTGTFNSSTVEYLCEEKLICPNYTNIDGTECFNEIKEGYYLKDSNNKILDKCHENCKTCESQATASNTNCKACANEKFLNFGNCINSCKYDYDTDIQGNNICKCSEGDKCKECSEESYNFGLCISCNEDDDFYPIFDENENNTNNFINCYKNPEGYYLDTDIGKYKPCHSNCKVCSGEGTTENNNCDM